MGLSEYRQPLARNKSEVITEESGVLLLAAGSMVETGHQVHELLAQDGIRSTLVNVRFLNALDEELIMRLIPEHDLVVTMEENVKRGGFGELVDTFLTERNLRVRRLNIALPDEFLEHGNPAELKKKTGLDAESIVERIQKMTV